MRSLFKLFLCCLLFQTCVKIDDNLHDPNEAGKWTLYDVANGLPSNNISAIATDKNGVLWVAFPGHGVAFYENGHWKLSNSGLTSDMATPTVQPIGTFASYSNAMTLIPC